MFHRTVSGALAVAALSVLAVGCSTDIAGEDPPAGQLHYPIGLALHPDGQSIFVVNTNFNVEFRRGSVAVLLLEEELPNSRVLGAVSADPPETRLLIDSFGGNLVLEGEPRTDADGTSFYRGYVPVREGNSVEVLRIDETTVPGHGGEQRKVWGALTNSRRVMTQRRDPFRALPGLSVTCPDGSDGGREVPLLAVEHLALGELVFIDLDALDRDIAGEPLEPEEEIIAGELNLPGGTVDMAIHPLTGELYLTSRFSNALEIIRPDPGTLCTECKVCDPGEDESCSLPDGCDDGWGWRSTAVNNTTGGGFDSRGLSFDVSGDRLYVANRGPDSLLVFNTAIEEETGEPRDELIDALPLPASPAGVRYLAREAPGRDLVLVTCFDEGRLWILDAETLLVREATPVGYGPYEMVVAQLDLLSGDGEPGRTVALVANFDEHSIAVVDLEEGSTFGAVIAQLQ